MNNASAEGLGFFVCEKVNHQNYFKLLYLNSSGLILIGVFCSGILSAWWLYRKHFVFQGESEKQVVTLLTEKASLIKNCAQKLEIDSRLLASIIYAERRMNVNLLDSFEHIYAEVGYNSSIGLAQIRLSTAKWILRNVIDKNSSYSLDEHFYRWLPSYRTTKDLINLLRDDSTNCLIAAFHIKQIIERWKREGYNIDLKPDIVATLYSYGLFRREDGKEILPHGKARSNLLGKIAASFYYSKKLKEEL